MTTRLAAAVQMLLCVALIASCTPATPEAAPAPPVKTPLSEPPTRPVPPPLSDAARTTVDDLRGIIRRNSLRQLARRANDEAAFLSNLDGTPHRTYWDLTRRIGIDPLAKLDDLLDEPHAAKTVDGQVWYIWPDLAALSSDELIPERLSFIDRARLLELVGEAGIESIRQGAPYPGMRTAIDETGRWRYFLQGEEYEE